MLKKLEKKGYITRVRSTVDERNLVLELTPEGEQLREKALTVPGKMVKCINLTDDEIKTLYKLLYKVLLNIEKEKE